MSSNVDNAEWLTNQYITQRKSLSDIAKLCGVSKQTVGRRLRSFGVDTSNTIPSPTKRKLECGDWLYEHHYDLGMSCAEIAKLLGVDTSTANRYLVASGLVVRSTRISPEIMKTLSSAEWLIDKHHIQRMNSNEIAKLLGVDGAVVRRSMVRRGVDLIPTKFSAHTNLCLDDRDWLYDQYVTQHRTQSDIANDLGVGRGVILDRLITHNIPVRIKKNSQYADQCLDDRDWLYDQYVTQRNPISLIAVDLDVPVRKVASAMMVHDVEVISVRLSQYADQCLDDRDWLYDQYVIRRTSICRIANELSVGYYTVHRRILSHNIPLINTRLPSGTPELLSDYSYMHGMYDDGSVSLLSVAKALGVGETTVRRSLTALDISINPHHSSGELELITFIQSIYKNEIITNARGYINSRELDVYLPELSLAFEYNGLYWHSERHKSKNYHLDKTNACAAIGITLVHIFEDDWLDRRTIIESKIRQALSLNINRVFARKTCVVIPSKKEKSDMYTTYHIQGDTSSSIDIGLVYDNALVACMSFRKRGGGAYELARYATAISVIGGFSKLLSYFKKVYTWYQLISFADLSWSRGDLYERTGWVLDKQLRPDYKYIVAKKRRHKFGFRHKQLKTKLKNYDPNLTEHQNMLNHKLYRIYDCGLLRYVMNNPTNHHKDVINEQ